MCMFAPKPDRTGNLLARYRQKLSIVWILRRVGDLRRSHPNWASFSSTLMAAKNRSSSSFVPNFGLVCIFAAVSRVFKIRLAISFAALRVKVMANTSSGFSQIARRWRNRRLSNSVFPEPAGACTAYEDVMS